MKTWQIELAVVALVLSVIAWFSGNGSVEWIGTAAVCASFAHGQITDRLAEQEAQRMQPMVRCHQWATRYFVLKESCWFAYFVLHRSWSALAGVLLFLAYPAWRRFWRSKHPLPPPEPPRRGAVVGC